MVARAWSYDPKEIHVPAGSEVTFRVTSVDVIHGFEITGIALNMMLIPGQISEGKATFHEEGEHIIVCHEYCGAGHQTMHAKIIVDPPEQAQAID
jgi:cytochrome c oxidase subunit 2